MSLTLLLNINKPMFAIQLLICKTYLIPIPNKPINGTARPKIEPIRTEISKNTNNAETKGTVIKFERNDNIGAFPK